MSYGVTFTLFVCFFVQHQKHYFLTGNSFTRDRNEARSSYLEESQVQAGLITGVAERYSFSEDSLLGLTNSSVIMATPLHQQCFRPDQQDRLDTGQKFHSEQECVCLVFVFVPRKGNCNWPERLSKLIVCAHQPRG